MHVVYVHVHARHGNERPIMVEYRKHDVGEKIVQRSYLPQSAFKVGLNALVGIRVANRAHITIGSHDNYGTFIFRHPVHFVSIFLISNAIGSHLCQSLNRSRDVSPFESLL
jgi:hypothetical protein